MSNVITLEDCQQKALGDFLSYWDGNGDTSTDNPLTYDEVIEALTYHENAPLAMEVARLEANLEKIGVWEPFENHPNEYVAEQIENQFESLLRFVGIASIKDHGE
jgi:hypothetical protein